MTLDELSRQVVGIWHRHNEILLYLLENIPEGGLGAKPTGSRGRDVARRFALALKQSGLRLPEKVAVQGLWGRWIFGK